MKIARFQFAPELCALLPRERRGGDFDYTFNGPQTIKHLVESVGIPHTEIGPLKANGEPVGSDYLVQLSDRIEIASPSEGNGGSSGSEPRFVLDIHLGRLTAHLRMLGMDCFYPDREYSDLQLALASVEQERILLSRDRHLLMYKFITQGYLLRSLEPEEQLLEVVQRFSLRCWIRPFQRCLRCNHPLQPVSKAEVLHRLEPLTRLYFEEFSICTACDQVYWKGSHHEHMLALIERAVVD
jgi:uncharacterized protein